MHGIKIFCEFLFILLLLIEVGKTDSVQSKSKEKDKRPPQRSNVNEYVDMLLEQLAPLIDSRKLDPMKLPDMREGFEAKPLLITYHGVLSLHSGYLSNFKEISRVGDTFLIYNEGSLGVETSLVIKSLNIYYNYVAQIMGLGPKGQIFGVVKNIVIVIHGTVDIDSYMITKERFVIKSIGKIDVKFGGNILTDWLINVLTKVVTHCFKRQITGLFSMQVDEFVDKLIAEANGNSLEERETKTARMILMSHPEE